MITTVPKTILILGVALFLVGCGQKACYDEVVKNHEGCEIRMIPERDFVFIVKTKDGDILYVETRGPTDKITFTYKVFDSKDLLE